MKPMLAATTDGTNLTYPLLASPKLDGIRALVIDGVVVSRSLKPIPNKHVQRLFGQPEFNGLDGELIVGDQTASDVFQKTESGVMSIDGTPNVQFCVFDKHEIGVAFIERFKTAVRTTYARHPVVIVPHQVLNTARQLKAFEELCLEKGYEGVMLRDPDGLYKHGRSTLKQGWLLKLKRFEDSEAKIIGFKEAMHNANEAKTNALGHKERSHKKAGMVGKDMLGAFIVEDLKTGVQFDIGTGFTEGQRKSFWRGREGILGAVVKYKYQPAGVKDKPRFPVFLGFRHKDDL